MALYTPFIERNIDKLANAINDGQQKKLAESAYMGDESAMGQLAGLNPQLAQQIQQGKARDEQQKLQTQAQAQQQRQAQHAQITEIAKTAANMPYEQAAPYADEAAKQLGINAPPLTPEHHAQFVAAYGERLSLKDKAQIASEDRRTEAMVGLSDARKVKIENTSNSQLDDDAITAIAKARLAGSKDYMANLMTGNQGAGTRLAVAQKIVDLGKEQNIDTTTALSNIQDYDSAQKVLDAFNKGPESKLVNAQNTVAMHLDSLRKASDALANHDLSALNKIANYLGAKTGDDPMYVFNAINAVAKGEVVKANTGVAGALADRDEIGNVFDSGANHAQRNAAIAAFESTIGDKILATENQYKIGTKRDDFRDKRLLPAGRSLIEHASKQYGHEAEQPLATHQKTGGVLHVDAQGNKAMVFPDGSYEEVK